MSAPAALSPATAARDYSGRAPGNPPAAAGAGRAPDNPDSREYLNELHKAGAPDREDIVTWFDVLDMDDFVSFGGKA